MPYDISISSSLHLFFLFIFFLFLVLPIYGPRLRLFTSWLQRTFKNLDHVQWPWSRINTQQVSSGHRHNKLLRKSSGRTQECVINKKVTVKLKRIGFFGFLFNFPEVNFNSLLIWYLSYLKWDQFYKAQKNFALQLGNMNLS